MVPMSGLHTLPSQQHAPMSGIWAVLAKLARVQEGQAAACTLTCRSFGNTPLLHSRWNTSSSRGGLAKVKAQQWTGSAARGVAKEDRRRDWPDRNSSQGGRASESGRPQRQSKLGQRWTPPNRGEQQSPSWQESREPSRGYRERVSHQFNGAQQSKGEASGWRQGSTLSGRWTGQQQREPSSQGHDSWQGSAGGRYMYPEKVGDPRLRKLKDEWQGDALFGINPVLAALRAGRREAHVLYVQEGVLDARKHKEAAQLQQAVRTAKEDGIPVEQLSKHDLNMLTDNSVHQGLLLSCSPLECEELDDFPPAESISSADGDHPVWVALDEITDPQNLGAVLRSAAFLGAEGVLTCARNSAPLSPAVSKASAGALESLTVHSCEAMQKTLERAREDGWAVLGGAAEEGALPCSEMSVAGPTILVLGSESKGLRTTVKRACSSLVRIDSLAEEGSNVGVDSLNVSVAAGILLHHLLLGQRR